MPEGGTLRDAFASYRRQVGRPHPQEVSADQIPESVAYLVQYFGEMCRGRPITEVGMLPIPASEMLAWSQLTGIRLARWELSAIVQLDQTYLRVMRPTPPAK
jgi:hypothetical protein